MGSRSRKVSSQPAMAGETPRVRATCLLRPGFTMRAADCASARRGDNIQSGKDGAKGAPPAELRLAGALALTGDWQAAPPFAGKDGDEGVASGSHAILHRLEGGHATA